MIGVWSASTIWTAFETAPQHHTIKTLGPNFFACRLVATIQQKSVSPHMSATYFGGTLLCGLIQQLIIVAMMNDDDDDDDDDDPKVVQLLISTANCHRTGCEGGPALSPTMIIQALCYSSSLFLVCTGCCLSTQTLDFEILRF